MLSRLLIHQNALRSNLVQLASLSANPASICVPVLKANAYGHGLEQVYKSLAGSPSLSWLAVNYICEAKVLRDLGFNGRILIVGPSVDPKETAEASRLLDLDVQAYDPEQWQIYIAALDATRIHIKVDTGLGRQGSLPALWEQFFSQNKWSGSIAGICMHYANVEDVQEHEYASLQRSRFSQIIKSFAALGIKGERVHCNASSSHVLFADAQTNLARLGISLYGSWPSQATKLSAMTSGVKCKLSPALSWQTKVAQVKTLEAGSQIGYGCTYTANAATTIAVIPVGYFEGYCREYTLGQPYVLIRAKRCPLLGRISMNMFVVDVTHLDKDAEVKAGEEVVLIGSQGKESISAENLAEWGQTIQYQVLTRLHPSIPREIVS